MTADAKPGAAGGEQRTVGGGQRTVGIGQRKESGLRFSEFVAPMGLFPDKVSGEAQNAHQDFAGSETAKGIKEVEKFRDEFEKLSERGGLPAAARAHLDATEEVIATVADAAIAQQSRQPIIINAVPPEDGRLDADNTPAGGVRDNHLVEWRRKAEDWHNIKVNRGSGWVKPFVCDFKPDDPNKNIEIVL